MREEDEFLPRRESVTRRKNLFFFPLFFFFGRFRRRGCHSALEIWFVKIYNPFGYGDAACIFRLCRYLGVLVAMKRPSTRQMELECGGDRADGGFDVARSPDDEVMHQIDRVIADTARSIRPSLNRMVRDVERLLEGSFIRTPGSNILDDIIEGLEKDIRKFVDEVKALNRWNRSSPPHSSSE